MYSVFPLLSTRYLVSLGHSTQLGDVHHVVHYVLSLELPLTEDQGLDQPSSYLKTLKPALVLTANQRASLSLTSLTDRGDTKNFCLEL